MAVEQVVDTPPVEAGPTGTPAPTTIINDDTPPIVAPQDWPDNWRGLMAGEDDKALKLAERYNSPTDIFKGFQEGRTKISQHTAESRLPAPTEESTPEELTAYRAENNVPEKAEDYNLDFGDGTVIGDDTKEQLGGFLEFAHSKNINNDSVKDTVQWFMSDIEATQEKMAAADGEAKINSITNLKSEWGAEYQGNINAMNSLFVNAPEGVRDALMVAKGSNGLSFGNNEDSIKWMVALAKELNPTATLVPPGPDQAANIDAEYEKIEGWMTSKDKKEKAKYWGNPEVQEAFQRLRAAKDKK